jgi:hypothetical protein
MSRIATWRGRAAHPGPAEGHGPWRVGWSGPGARSSGWRSTGRGVGSPSVEVEGLIAARGLIVNPAASNDGGPSATTPGVTQHRQGFLRPVRTGNVARDHSRSLAKVSRTAGMDEPGDVLGSDIIWSMQSVGSRKGRLNSVSIVGPPPCIVSAVRHLCEESHREGHHDPTPSTRQEPMGDYTLSIG